MDTKKTFSILAVDDSGFIRASLKKTLTNQGLNVITARDGAQAMKVLAEDPTVEIHLVLTDLNMPVMNGEELCRKIKSDPQYAHLPVVFLTSQTDGETRERLMEAGADEFMAKPFVPDALAKRIFSHLKPGSSPEGNPLQILLVEDNKLNQKLISKMLSQAGHRVSLADNGKEGFEAAQRAVFDLILMDGEMPVMNGIESTEKIRQWERENKKEPLPILALTALEDEKTRENFLAAGMNDVLTKPIQPEELDRIVRLTCRPKKAYLVVTPDADSQNQIQNLLTATGEVSLVASGVEALNHLSQADASPTLLVDMVLPDFSGPELIRKVRQWAALKSKRIPIVMISQVSQDPRKEYGEDLFLRKPLDRGDLEKILGLDA